MNKKGFISISIVYSFFLVFIAIVLGILASYTSRRYMMVNIKKDIRDKIDSFSNFDCFSNGITKLNECIIHTYGGEETIADQIVSDFNQVTVVGEYGLYSAADNYGTSYYFRGDVQNNYIQFGQTYDGIDMYWRIVRINGDGSIRLIYDGTILKPNNKEELDWDTVWLDSVIRDNVNSEIINTKYNSIGSSVADKKYVGYTYDDGTGNQVDSSIKSKIDRWYEYTLLDYYSKYLADNGFCNDRTFVSTNEYAAHSRIYIAPVFTCSQTDSYTVSDEYGNGYLTYPIAILSADEFVFAGAIAGVPNTTYFLSGPGGWTMTPSHSDSYENYSTLWTIDWQGGLSVWYPEADIPVYFPDIVDKYIRPVINLKADVEIKDGNGTIDSPFVLEEVGY